MKSTRLIIAAIVFSTALVVAPQYAHAGTGIYTPAWSDSHFTVSKTTHKYSNATGMWQAILASNQCMYWVDGIFGNETETATKSFQTTLGIPATGVADDWTWLFAYWFVNPATGSLARQYGGSAYGFDFWSYYGGAAVEAELAWNSGGSQWWFEIPAFTGTWYASTASRAMSSHTYC